jgi:hypothetical protein
MEVFYTWDGCPKLENMRSYDVHMGRSNRVIDCAVIIVS